MAEVTINKVIAALGRKRNSIRKAEAKLSDLKEEFHELEDQLMQMMKAQGLESASSGSLIASRTQHEVAKISDWRKLAKWVYNNDGLDVFQNRLSITSIRARREEGETIPGVVVEKLQKLSLRAKPKRG